MFLWGVNSRNFGDLDQSERLLEESRRFYLKRGSWFLGVVYFNQARLYSEKGQFTKARDLFEQALPLIKEVDGEGNWMWWHAFKGEMDLSQAVDIASLRDAEAELVECMEIAKKFGNRQFFLFSTPILLAKKAFQLGEVSMAVERYRETVQRYRSYFHRSLWTMVTFPTLDNVSSGWRKLRSAWIIPRAAQGFWVRWINWASWIEMYGMISLVKILCVSRSRHSSRLAQADFLAAWAEGREMSLGQAIELALDEPCVKG